MIDDPRLEARLRDDSTGDPRYVPGRFRDRVARAATQRPMARPRALVGQPLGAILIAAVLIGLAVIMSPRQNVGPEATPTPTPISALDPGAIQSALDAWSRANGTVPASVFLVDRRGAEYAFTTKAAGPLTTSLSVRIGELSRVYVAGAAVALEECLIPGAVPGFACPTAPSLEAFDLDDPVTEWLPEAGLDPAITVRSLLEGTSGLPPVGPTLADLTSRVAADPGADWSRATVLAAALRQASRFPPGSRREPVDTESMLLDDIIAKVEGRAPGLWIEAVTSHAIGDLGQGSWTRAWATTIVPGTSPAMHDLDPTVLAIVRDAGGMWATSDGLAHSSVELWGAAIGHAVEGLKILTDSDNGRAMPISAVGVCPCVGDQRLVVASTGHAVAWSAMAAYDFGVRVGIGVTATVDVPDAALMDLLDRILTATRG